MLFLRVVVRENKGNYSNFRSYYMLNHRVRNLFFHCPVHWLRVFEFLPFFGLDNFVLVWAQLIEIPLSRRFGYPRVLSISVPKMPAFSVSLLGMLRAWKWSRREIGTGTPFAVHCEGVRAICVRGRTVAWSCIRWREKDDRLRVGQIQLRFLHFNQHSTELHFWAFLCVVCHIKGKNTLSFELTFKSWTPSWKSIETMYKQCYA